MNKYKAYKITITRYWDLVEFISDIKFDVGDYLTIDKETGNYKKGDTSNAIAVVYNVEEVTVDIENNVLSIESKKEKAMKTSAKKSKKEVRKNDVVKYYTLYDNRAEERIVVCLLKRRLDIVRGVSVCSYKDTFNEEKGQLKAYAIAIRMIEGRKVDQMQTPEVIRVLIDSGCPFTQKGYKNPELSWFERKLIFGNYKLAEKWDKYMSDFKDKVNKAVIDSFIGTLNSGIVGCYKSLS